MTSKPAPLTPSAVADAAVRTMCREAEQADRLATIRRWAAYVPLAHFSAADRALLRWHRRLEREVKRSLRALAREHRARVLAARRAEYAAWDAAMQHERASTCPACAP